MVRLMNEGRQLSGRRLHSGRLCFTNTQGLLSFTALCITANSWTITQLTYLVSLSSSSYSSLNVHHSMAHPKHTISTSSPEPNQWACVTRTYLRPLDAQTFEDMPSVFISVISLPSRMTELEELPVTQGYPRLSLSHSSRRSSLETSRQFAIALGGPVYNEPLWENICQTCTKSEAIIVSKTA